MPCPPPPPSHPTPSTPFDSRGWVLLETGFVYFGLAQSYCSRGGYLKPHRIDSSFDLWRPVNNHSDKNFQLKLCFSIGSERVERKGFSELTEVVVSNTAVYVWNTTSRRKGFCVTLSGEYDKQQFWVMKYLLCPSFLIGTYFQHHDSTFGLVHSAKRVLFTLFTGLTRTLGSRTLSKKERWAVTKGERDHCAFINRENIRLHEKFEIFTTRFQTSQ